MKSKYFCKGLPFHVGSDQMIGDQDFLPVSLIISCENIALQGYLSTRTYSIPFKSKKDTCPKMEFYKNNVYDAVHDVMRRSIIVSNALRN